MSHTLSKVNLGNNALALVTIIDYALGGEAFTLAELGLTSLSKVLFLDGQGGVITSPILITNPPCVAVLISNKVVLQIGGKEIPASVGLNYTFAAIVQG